MQTPVVVPLCEALAFFLLLTKGPTGAGTSPHSPEEYARAHHSLQRRRSARMQGPPGHPATILLVEDDPVEVRLLQEVFKVIPGRAQLHVVHTGNEALAFLRREAPYQRAPRPALILLTLKLPGLSGHELLAELKREPDLRLIPALV